MNVQICFLIILLLLFMLQAVMQKVVSRFVNRRTRVDDNEDGDKMNSKDAETKKSLTTIERMLNCLNFFCLPLNMTSNPILAVYYWKMLSD